MEYSEKPLIKEHAYNVSEKQQGRRKFLKGTAKAVAAGVAAVSVLAGAGNAIEQAEKEGFRPDSYYAGKIEITMSDNLNLREAPVVISNPNMPPNTVNWHDVVEINGVKVEGNERFTISNPLITEGDDPLSHADKGSWITFDAKVNQPLGEPKEENLYVSLSSVTNEYVKPVESGSFIKISPETSTQGLGTITLNH